MLVMVADVGEMTVKRSCKYGEYGSFEQLFFLVCFGVKKSKLCKINRQTKSHPLFPIVKKLLVYWLDLKTPNQITVDMFTGFLLL